MMQVTVRLRQIPPFAHRAGVIKRVIRVSGRCMCAICRSPYDDEAEALSCLGRCWQELLALDPIIPRLHGDEQRYVCRFCARPHLMIIAAQQCAKDCREKNIARYEAERRLHEEGKNLPPPPKRKWRSRTSAQLVRVTATPAPARKAPEPELILPTGEPVQVPTVNADVRLAPVAPKGSVIDDKADKKKKPDKPFYRDGAEYVCNMCNKKYFTRIEVQACFDAHPE